MFKLIRRISHSVFPRPDKPWEEDATSNAPHRSRKRRLSSDEGDDADEEQVGKKKVRGDSATPSVADADAVFLAPAPPQTGAEEVKEVTEGVKEVDLEEESMVDTCAAPETIPLPEEKSGELDEPTEDAVGDPPMSAEEQATVANDKSHIDFVAPSAAAEDETLKDKEDEVKEDATPTSVEAMAQPGSSITLK